MERAEIIFRRFITILGALTLMVFIVFSMVLLIGKIDDRIQNPPIQSGTVTGFVYDDGHPWYSDYVFGKYTFREKHGDGKKHYYVAVENNGNDDIWEIDQETYQTLEVGQTVSRKLIERKGN